MKDPNYTRTLRILSLVLTASALLSAYGPAARGTEIAAPCFSQIYDRYLGLCGDPSAGRDKWLEVIRSFASVGQNESDHTRSKRLFLAGRASFTLYAREGRIEDLDKAIRYFDEVKRITGQNNRVSGILRELRTTHELHRTHGSDRALKQSGSAPVEDTGSGAGTAVPPPPPASISGKGPQQYDSVAFPAAGSGSRSARPSAVYQGNPFFPARRPAPLPNPSCAGSARTGIESGRTPYGASIPAVTACPPRPVKPDAAPIKPQPREYKRSFVVVIDPGHGGKDPGAVSSDGKLNEKGVTLYTARRLKKLLEQRDPGMRVKLTRTGDEFLTVSQRTAAANSWNADLFISIHCNSYPDAGAYGIETYYLSKAGSERAMRVAARENDISPEKMSDLEATLLDLMMTSKKSESEKLAETVQTALTRSILHGRTSGRDRGVKRGPFYVLLGAAMPAILVECGYISNPGDRKKLGNKRYLDSLARGIASGAHAYLKGLGRDG